MAVIVRFIIMFMLCCKHEYKPVYIYGCKILEYHIYFNVGSKASIVPILSEIYERVVTCMMYNNLVKL